MSKKMLIDAAHPEETRVVVVDGARVEEFDYETAAKATLTGNIYLAKVTRVEPSLQAAFVDYGGGRHGFLAFSEIHPDYYQIPAEDRAALIEAERQAEAEIEREQEEAAARRSRGGEDGDGAAAETRGDGRKTRRRSEADGRNGRRNRRRGRPRRDEETRGGDSRVLAFDHQLATVDLPPALSAAMAEGGALASLQASSSAPSLEDIDALLAAAAPETIAGALEAERRLIEARSLVGDDLSDDEPSEDEAEDGAEQEGAEQEAADRNGAGQAGGVAEDQPMAATAFVAEAALAAGRGAAGAEVMAEASGRRWSETATADAVPAGAGASVATEAIEPQSRERDPRDVEERPDAEEREEDAIEDLSGGDADDFGAADRTEEVRLEARRRLQRLRDYKIQEVIKRRQIMLVQVIKEERGNKGAALTTYLSLAGRYCVLMPNTARGGGVSRKITNAADRKRLKAIAAEFDVPEGMGLIVRTAGANRTRAEMQRDYEYLLRQWSSIRDLTLKSVAPTLIYEEGSLIKRSIRDLYGKEIDNIVVEGEAGFAEARDYMAMLLPTHVKSVEAYRGRAPLFVKNQVESQISGMLNPTVQLKSGGYIVIGVTEALVAIDVNSGRSTKEASIENTALKTNLEAADEISRQLRLRDLAGLIVIDFIDMEDQKNNRAVEKRLKERLKTDRARIQVGRISGFGLLEMSRQRLRPGLLEATTSTCPHCRGAGVVRSNEASALSVLRALEEAALGARLAGVRLIAPIAVANYILNAKRERIADLEDRCDLRILVEAAPELQVPDFKIERIRQSAREDEGHPGRVSAAGAIQVEEGYRAERDDEEAAEESEGRSNGDRGRNGRRRGGREDAERDEGRENRRGRRRREAEPAPADAAEAQDAAPRAVDEEFDDTDPARGDESDAAKRKRRGRRGGRRRRRGEGEEAGAASDPMPVIDLGDADEQSEEDAPSAEDGWDRAAQADPVLAAAPARIVDPEASGPAPSDVAAGAAATDISVVEPPAAPDDAEAGFEPASAPRPAPPAQAAQIADAAAPQPIKPARRLADFFKDAGLVATGTSDATASEPDMATTEAPSGAKTRRTGWWAFRRG